MSNLDHPHRQLHGINQQGTALFKASKLLQQF